MEDTVGRAETAVELYKSGRTAEANRIVKEMLEGETDGLLQPLAAYGGELRQKAEESVQSLSSWHLGQSTDAPEHVALLHTLADLLTDRIAATQSWNMAWMKWKICLVQRMRDEMIRLNHKGSNELALQVCKQALLLSVHPAQVAQLEQDKAALTPMAAQIQARRKAMEEVEPVADAPSLRTVNFIGFQLYGHTPFPEDSRLYYANQYFSVLWVPIFPIGRYLVEKIGSGQWRFHGQTKWTTEMKVHLVVAIAVILGVIVVSALSRAPN